MNLGEFRTEIIDRCGLVSGDTVAGATYLNRQINLAVHWVEMANPFGWSWLHTADIYVPDGISFEVPINGSSGLFGANVYTAEVRAVTAIRPVDWPNSYGDPLPLVPADDALRSFPNLKAVGYPQMWSLWVESTDQQRAVLFRPAPPSSVDLHVFGILSEPTLTTDGSSPIVPVRYHEAVVERAAAKVYRRLHNRDEANDAQTAADQWIKRMLQADNLYRGPGQVSYDRSRDSIV